MYIIYSMICFDVVSKCFLKNRNSFHFGRHLLVSASLDSPINSQIPIATIFKITKINMHK